MSGRSDNAHKGELSYSAAGVDIEAGEKAVQLIKKDVESTYIPGVLSSLGGFAGAYELPAGLTNPVLITATDGVGTKLLLAQEIGKLHTVGIDLVAMSVNDVLTVGAKPVLFLDYVATGKLQPAEMVQIVAGVAEGCRQARCALVGGEMAEMPGLYTPGEFDLAGFCVGIGEKNELLDGSAISKGDVVLGLASNGFHSNGYSLVRKVLEVSGLGLGDKFQDLLNASAVSADMLPASEATIAEVFLEPTRIYTGAVLDLLETGTPIHGMAHITGGGMVGNLSRIIPDGLSAQLDWQVPPLFRAIQKLGHIAEKEMFSTFNMGVGFVLVLPSNFAKVATEYLCAAGETVLRLGGIVSSGAVEADDSVDTASTPHTVSPKVTLKGLS